MGCKENAEFVRDWLKEKDWNFSEKTFDDGVVRFRTSVAADCPACRGYDVTLLCREHDVQSLYYPPVQLPGDKKARAEFLELANRINYRFRIGKLTVDMRDGEVRFETVKTDHDLKADRDDAIDDLIGFPGYAMDKFMPGMMLVALGAKSAKDAFEECDRKEEPPPEEPPPELPPEDILGDDAPTSDAVDPAAGSQPAKKKGKSGKKAKAAPPPEDDLFSMAELLGAQSKDAENEPKAKRPEASAPASNYSLEGLNLTTKVPLEDIVAAVKSFRSGKGRPDVDAPRLNILLSGAPGSGKTAFVKYLAREVGAPLRTLKASDLICRYTGETEKRIAESFRKAKENGEILFLDEIDSFLQDRTGASHSWEVTQVNELLQQMEEFGGVLVGATNFVDNLDKAVLRRFTYKLKLDYLTDAGKNIFFERYFKTPLTEDEKVRLNAIGNLTPGDFRTVREELFYLANRQTNAARLDALAAESEAKGRTAARIGFSA